MQRSSHAGKTPFLFSPSLHRQLNSYAIAASAAGVSLLALPQPLEAKVVYTKEHQAIGWNGIYELDLNHDGIVDFVIHEWPFNWYSFLSTASSNRLFVREALGNAVVGGAYQAAALKRGAPIGSGQQFVSYRSLGENMAVVFFSSEYGYWYVRGNWVNVTSRYLGLKFQIKGETHYGWARLNVEVGYPSMNATLTAYAYESVPDKEIIAGQKPKTTDLDSARSGTLVPQAAHTGPSAQAPAPLSLGALARGAQGRGLRRKP